jgi:hypothetical protein
MKRLIIIFAVYLVTTTSVFACDCDYQGPFLKMAQRTPFVALVKVKKYLTFEDIYNVKTPMSMEVEIIDVYKGKETRKTVKVWGDIGNLCRPYLSEFKEEKYYVIAFYSGNYGGRHPDEKDSDYAICNCGAYWLTVDFEKSNVTGDIDSKDRTFVTESMEQLKSKLAKTTANVVISTSPFRGIAPPQSGSLGRNNVNHQLY